MALNRLINTESYPTIVDDLFSYPFPSEFRNNREQLWSSLSLDKVVFMCSCYETLWIFSRQKYWHCLCVWQSRVTASSVWPVSGSAINQWMCFIVGLGLMRILFWWKKSIDWSELDDFTYLLYFKVKEKNIWLN